MVSCPDCKGSGKYIGILAQEDCRSCNGAGRLPDKEKALESIFRAQPQDHNRFQLKPHKLLPKLKIGDIIHVYDAGWYETEVDRIDYNPIKWVDAEMVYTSDGCNKFRIPFTELSYNVIKGRWEYIRTGTPLLP